MEFVKQNKIGKVLKVVLIVAFILGVPSIIISPILLNHTRKIIYSMFVIYPNGILMLLIIYEFIRLFKSLEDNNPFTYKNVKILKQTGFISLIMSILWLIDLLFMVFIINNRYINYIIVLLFLFILFFGVCIALYILSELIKQATIYKEDNDLTI